MTTNKKPLLFPVGRMVMGSTTKPQTDDADGNPLVVKKGPNIGQPTQRYFFAVAYAKTAGKPHWAHEPWGAEIWALGHLAFPQGQAQAPTFSWKIVDGDSTVPNKKGKKPCEREGYAGNWVVSFSSGFAPKCYNADGTAPIDPESIKLGFYVQVNATIDGNESQSQPGVYINHDGISLQAFGKEIFLGVDPSTVGFGKGVALPAGASAVPIGTFTPPATVATAAPALPAAPPIPGAPAPAPAPIAPTAVAPSASFVPAAVPAAAPPPPAAPAAPAAPPAGKLMTAAANGIPYASYIAQGWKDDQLIAAGFLQVN